MSSKKSQWTGTPTIVVQDVEPIRRKGAQVYPTLSVDCIQVLPPAFVDAYVSPLSLNYKAGVVHLNSIATTQVKSGKNVESKSGENSFTSVDIASTRGETSWLNGSTQSHMTEEITPNCFSLKTGLTKLTATLLATMTSSTSFGMQKKGAVVISIPDLTPIEIYPKKNNRKRIKLDANTKDPKCSKITVVLVVVALLACVAMGIVFYMEYVYKVDLLASRNRGNITSSSLVDLSVEVKEKFKDLLLGEWGDESLPVISGKQESVTACASTEKGEIGGRVTAKMSENFMKRLNQAKPPARI